MGDKKLSDLTTGDVGSFMLKVFLGFVGGMGIIILIAWLTSC